MNHQIHTINNPPKLVKPLPIPYEKINVINSQGQSFPIITMVLPTIIEGPMSQSPPNSPQYSQ